MKKDFFLQNKRASEIVVTGNGDKKRRTDR